MYLLTRSMYCFSPVASSASALAPNLPKSFCSVSTLSASSMMRFVLGQSQGAASLKLPITLSLSFTFVSLPARGVAPFLARQRMISMTPPFSFCSALSIALPNAMRASVVKCLSPTPRITSPTSNTPSATDPVATCVIRICRARVVMKFLGV